VVCFDLGGPGLHVNAECGFKVPARDPAQAVCDMADALEILASDRNLRAQMGRAALERARQVYDWDRVTERIIEAYEQALGISTSESPKTPSGEAT
jgi:glycosyltransferase involved in cell wall biosynthesis